MPPSGMLLSWMVRNGRRPGHFGGVGSLCLDLGWEDFFSGSVGEPTPPEPL